MYWPLLLLIFVFAVVFHLLMLRYASGFGLIDVPNERSVHKKQVPRGAGIALFSSVALAHAILNHTYILNHLYLHAAILLVFLVGVLDDKSNTSPRIKFLIIFFATILLYQEKIYIDFLGNYFGYNITLPLLMIFPFTFFAIAGFTNALNLIDGLDGLAGGVSFIILSTFLTIGIVHDDLIITTLSSSFLVALSVFLFFNWNPAKIFMGDSGSLTLGFVLAILAILSIKYTSPAAVLFIIAIPLLDTFIVMTRRIQRGESPFKADKNHMHHFLLKVKGDVPHTVILLISIQILFSLIGYQLCVTNQFLSLFLFGVLFFVFLNFFDQRIRRRKRKPKKKAKGKRAAPIILESGMSDTLPIPVKSELP